MFGEAIPILCYHRVLPELIEEDVPIYSVTPQQFNDQLAYLAQHGFQSLSLSEYSEILRGQRPIPPRPVLITFDDGYADIYSQAWPIARRYGMILNLFVCTSLICGQQPAIYSSLPASAKRHRQARPELWRPLTWTELRQMLDGGVGLGFHSHNHSLMSVLSETALREDLDLGLHLCERELGFRPRFFALPHGTYQSYNDRVLSALRESGIERVFTTRLRLDRVGKPGFLSSRIVVHQEDDLEAFEHKLYGAYDWMGHLRHLIQILQSLL
ncbi:MAG TPA: polysaccharide deacetylase family protein [Blastocatellia bacterium]|nr:polysaccharide deacetylase family protein [Blastocatellia bacterium]